MGDHGVGGRGLTVGGKEERWVVGEDGVHLSVKANSFSAVNLCHRLAEMALLDERWDGGSGSSVAGAAHKRLRRQ
jgi:hypothetical protein